MRICRPRVRGFGATRVNRLADPVCGSRLLGALGLRVSRGRGMSGSFARHIRSFAHPFSKLVELFGKGSVSTVWKWTQSGTTSVWRCSGLRDSSVSATPRTLHMEQISRTMVAAHLMSLPPRECAASVLRSLRYASAQSGRTAQQCCLAGFTHSTTQWIATDPAPGMSPPRLHRCSLPDRIIRAAAGVLLL